MERSVRRPGGLLGSGLAAGAVTVTLAALAMVFVYAPSESIMGDVQRIFYFHVASAWVGFFAFFIVFLTSALYLLKSERRWDVLALSSGEVGLVFITMTVISGSLWARPTWGTYWTWEPRLTVSAVQLLVYLAYVTLRGMVDGAERGARLAAVYGIVAFATVPLSWFAIRRWRTIHPQLMDGGGGMAITSPMVHTLLVSIVAFSLLYVAFVWRRALLEQQRDHLGALRLRIEEEEEEAYRQGGCHRTTRHR